MYGWNDFSFKNVLGAAYNQVRFIDRNLRYLLLDLIRYIIFKKCSGAKALKGANNQIPQGFFSLKISK